MGFEYGHSGPAHYALEDVAALRTLPGLTIVVPADFAQAATAIRGTQDVPGPVYYSLGKDDAASLEGLGGRFELGKVQFARVGKDIAIVTMGSIAREVNAAAEELSTPGIDAAVLVVSNFSPDPESDMAGMLSLFRQAITVEAQTVSGGLGSFVASVIATRGLVCRLQVMGIRTPPDGTSGKQAERWRKYGLDRESIVNAVTGALRG